MDYKKVIEDYNNGTIDPNEWQLVMDNDGGYWKRITPEPDDDVAWVSWNVECDAKEQEMGTRYGFPDGYRDVVEILKAAGVNSDWC